MIMIMSSMSNKGVALVDLVFEWVSKVVEYILLIKLWMWMVYL